MLDVRDRFFEIRGLRFLPGFWKAYSRGPNSLTFEIRSSKHLRIELTM
jgi:hypothetical protein